MTLNEYQNLAARTINHNLTEHETLDHALRGLPAEVGEVCGIFQKQLQGHPVDMDSVAKEIGDCLWMIAELCTVLGLRMDDIAEGNIAKLRRRYPDGFEAERSLHRE